MASAAFGHPVRHRKSVRRSKTKRKRSGLHLVVVKYSELVVLSTLLYMIARSSMPAGADLVFIFSICLISVRTEKVEKHAGSPNVDIGIGIGTLADNGGINMRIAAGDQRSCYHQLGEYFSGRIRNPHFRKFETANRRSWRHFLPAIAFRRFEFRGINGLVAVLTS